MNKRFTIHGKKWFDKVNGNTYHVAYLFDNETNTWHISDLEYGYDRQYELTAYNLAVFKKLIDESNLAFSDFLRTSVENSTSAYYLKRDLTNGEAYTGKQQKV